MLILLQRRGESWTPLCIASDIAVCWEGRK